jgi:hypothetical protein
MFPVLNPWLLLGAVSVIAASFFGGLSAGKKIERSAWLEREQEYQSQIQAETDRANKVATIYSQSLATSQDTAFNLRRKINEQREQLASCLPGGGVRFSSAFVGLYNDALQSPAANTGKPAGPPDGAGADTVLDTHVENGRRWKDCRTQLNSLIDILEPLQ